MLIEKGLKKVKMPCPWPACVLRWVSGPSVPWGPPCAPLSGKRPHLTHALFPPAPAAGGAGRGTCQAGHHDGAKRHHRGTWTPQSASHRVYSPFIPLIYHNQRAPLTLAGLKEWQPQGSNFPRHLTGLDPFRALSPGLPHCLPVPK